MRPITFRAYDAEAGIYVYSDKEYEDEGDGWQAWFGFEKGVLKAWASRLVISSDRDEPDDLESYELSEVEQYTGFYDCTTWDELTEDEREAWTQAGHVPSAWEGREIYE